ncbi:hypothetical protein [Priestia flexa]|uniref:hypothetical protein n=1 Tax=Priestia flexa TaxID=86664 RepID=UPI0024916983|nr:hypothetical protein [Priestia flexa]
MATFNAINPKSVIDKVNSIIRPTSNYLGSKIPAFTKMLRQASSIFNFLSTR